MSDNEVDIIEEEFEDLVYESDDNNSDEELDDNQSDSEEKEEKEEEEDEDDNKTQTVNEEEEEEDDEIDEMLLQEDTEEFEIKKQRMLKLLTKYEKVKMIGIRTMQLEHGAQPKINWKQLKLTTPYDIACKEFELNKIPFSIRRYITRDVYADFKLKDLEVVC